MKRILEVLFCIISGFTFSQEEVDISEWIRRKYVLKSVADNIFLFTLKYSDSKEIRLDKRRLHNLLNDKCELDLKCEHVDVVFPDTTFQFYRIRLSGDYFCQGVTISYLESHGRPIAGDDTYLVAFKNGSSLKFISGNMFCDPIKNYFEFDESNPSSFIPFLLVKTYNYQTTKIEFDRKEGDRLIFKSSVLKMKDTADISVSLLNYDDVKVKYAYR